MESTSSSPIKYRHIKVGYGRTFHFPHQGPGQQQLTHVGTTACTTTMGIYLPIDSNRPDTKSCFVAHINAFVKVRNPNADGGWQTQNQDIRAEEGISIQNQVAQKLKDCSTRDGWTARDVLDYSRRTGVNPVIVCTEVFTAPARPARFVAGGISTFLGIEACDILGQQSKGFVVEHATGQAQYIFSCVGDRDERRIFEKVEEEIVVKEWDVGVWRQEIARR